MNILLRAVFFIRAIWKSLVAFILCLVLALYMVSIYLYQESQTRNITIENQKIIKDIHKDLEKLQTIVEKQCGPIKP